MLKWLPFLALAIIPPGCQTKSLPPPSDVVSAPALVLALKDKDSKLSAHAEATEIAIKAGPEGAQKDAASGAISVVRSLAGPSSPEDRSAALSLVNQALSGKLEEAKGSWDRARMDAMVLTDTINELEQTVAKERVQAAADLQAKLKEAQEEANAARKKWITMIFFGLGALGTAGGVVMLVLGANPATAASYAFLGPKAAFCAIGAGLTLIATGIAVNAIERALESHPWVIWTGLGLAAASGIVASSLILSNHLHANESK